MSVLSNEIIQKLHLKLTDKTVNDSFIMDCVFYQIEELGETFLTNYDIEERERDMIGQRFWWAFSKNGNWFGKMLITEDFLESVSYDELKILLKRIIHNG